MTTEHFTCKELIDFLDDYVAGELPSDRHTRFDRHLRFCPSCRAYLASYRETISTARLAAPPHPAIEDVPPELLTLILASVARNTGH
jgi:anti-sigma factor RsiW